MPSVSLCVRVAFGVHRPSDSWLLEHGGRFDGISDGAWMVFGRQGGPYTHQFPGPDGWAASWQCEKQLSCGVEGAMSRLLDIAASIEEAWERENAPAVETAVSGPALALCPVCGRELQRSTARAMFNRKQTMFASYGCHGVGGCGYRRKETFPQEV